MMKRDTSTAQSTMNISRPPPTRKSVGAIVGGTAGQRVGSIGGTTTEFNMFDGGGADIFS